MSEVCTYGGDAGTPVIGYVWFPQTGSTCCNRLEVGRVPYGAMSTVMWTAKVNFDVLGSPASNPIMGWGFGLAVSGDRRLQIALLSNAITTLGNAPSEIPVPGLVTGVDVWLRGRFTSGSSLCEYWYAYDEALEEDLVTWVPLGTPQVGITGTPALSISNITIIGNWGVPVNIPGMGGNMYYASETVDGVRTLVMRHTDIPDDTTPSFGLSLGGTANVFRGAEPNTFLSPFSSSGSTYGMGHYGLCDQVQRAACSSARDAANPRTTQLGYQECELVECGS